MTMLEQMAEAIEAKVRAAGAIYDYDATDIARAALLAIREPANALEEIGAPWTDNILPGSAFTAMIDAILEEKA